MLWLLLITGVLGACLALTLYLKGKEAKELEMREEVIKNVRKANKARTRVKSDSGYRRSLRKKYTKK